MSLIYDVMLHYNITTLYVIVFYDIILSLHNNMKKLLLYDMVMM